MAGRNLKAGGENAIKLTVMLLAQICKFTEY